MISVSRSLYRALARHIRSFQKEEIPILGCVNQPNYGCSLQPLDQLKEVFRATRDAPHNLERGFTALRQLQSQLSVLRACESQTLEVLSDWHQLLSSTRGRLQTQQQLGSALVEAACLTSRIAMHGSNDLFEDEQEEEITCQAVQETLSSVLPEPTSTGLTDDQPMEDKLQRLNQAFFKQLRFRSDPIEWVYDGLGPGCIDKVLQHKKGVPLMLAIIYTYMATTHSVPLIPRLAQPVEQTHAQMDDVHMAAQRAKRALATYPTMEAWVLHVRGTQQTGDLFVDVGRGGKVMTRDELLKAYPGTILQDENCEATYINVVQALVRMMVMAHQRRGESDAVAHWMYQLLALQPSAEEWQFVLQTPQHL